MAIIEEYLQIPEPLEGNLWKFVEAESTGMRNTHYHQELELNLVTSGEASYVIAGKRYSIRSGIMLWLFPEQHHLLVDCSPDFSAWIGIFRPRLLQRICQGDAAPLLLKNPEHIFLGNVRPRTCRFLESLFEDLNQCIEQTMRFNTGLSYSLLSAWAAYKEAEQDVHTERLHPAVGRVIALLDTDHLDTPLPELACQAGLSYSRLSRLFKKEMGRSLSSFRDRVRVEHFCELQRMKPHNTMLDNALAAGFGSYAQFYRVFKQHMGDGPAAHKKNKRSLNQHPV